ncbi:MAG TPA: tyrosine-type recombinase/integrase [Woeseiaceae bacterium]|nr:tyrosine-type recombinase/integrase [Woeseiaceae bacterium]
MSKLNKLASNAPGKAKPGKTERFLADGGGLVLCVQPAGGKWWRLRYRWGTGKTRKAVAMSLGTFPDVSLAAARARRDEARKLLASDPPIDPRAVKIAEKEANPESLRALASEFLNMQTTGAARTTQRRFELHVYPYLGNKAIAEITALELLAVLKRIEHKGSRDTAHRVRSACSRVWKYAVGSGRAEHDIAAALQGQLAPVNAQHFASITQPAEIGGLLRAIDGYSGLNAVTAALKLAPLVFVRPGELRAATWSEIDREAAEWRIPARRTKQGREHLVPLSEQAIAILDDLAPLTGPKGYLFPSVRTDEKPISDNSLNAALRRLGYTREEMTAHGFRSMASTRLNEMGYSPDVIEAQLGHVEKSKVRRAYNHAQYLSQRRKLMQAWADYLDILKASGDTAT